MKRGASTAHPICNENGCPDSCPRRSLWRELVKEEPQPTTLCLEGVDEKPATVWSEGISLHPWYHHPITSYPGTPTLTQGALAHALLIGPVQPTLSGVRLVARAEGLEARAAVHSPCSERSSQDKL